MHWIILVTPGANFFLVSQLAASGQRRTALQASLGICTVTLIWASLAVLGIGWVFHTYPWLRIAMQLGGGGYLLWLAWKLWPSAAPAGQAAAAAPLRYSGWQAYRTGFLTNILNPKTALFFASVFATALPHQPPVWLIVCAVLLAWVNAMTWHLFIALAFSQTLIQRWYARSAIRMTRLAALVIGGFGIKLLWTSLAWLTGS